MTTDRTFDYVPRLDPRNLAYRLSAAPTDLLQKPRYWVPGVVLDQGSEGACVGFGVVGEAIASPARVRLTYPETAALATYRQAQKIDEWEGESYEGTSVRAGMLVGRATGWYEGFRWALNMGELRAALELGPVVVGVEWREEMYTAPEGLVSATGQVVGGHCILVTGYSPDWRRAGPFYRLRNSWGPSWGINGSAYISTWSLDSILFRAGGEAAVPIGRKL